MTNIQFAHWHELYPRLGVHGSVLPDEGILPQMVQVTSRRQTGTRYMRVFVKSAERARQEQAKTRAGLVYRVLVECSCCGEWVPFGKMGQHFQSVRCLRAGEQLDPGRNE